VIVVDLHQIGKLLVALGSGAVLFGLLLMLLGRLGGVPRLPGDIVIQRPGLTIYLPLGASIALSILLTAILWACAYFRR